MLEEKCNKLHCHNYDLGSTLSDHEFQPQIFFVRLDSSSILLSCYHLYLKIECEFNWELMPDNIHQYKPSRGYQKTGKNSV